MTEDSLVAAERKRLGWYEETIPVRGCYLSLEHIKEAYRELSAINKSFGEQLIAQLPRDPNMSDKDWADHKAALLSDAFCVTTTVSGLRDQQFYGETIDTFDSEELPKPIKSIYFTNINSFRRNSNGSEPKNRFSVFLDFSKPEMFDPKPLVSAATPNSSNVNVAAEDISFFRSVQKVVENRLTAHKTWYGMIHRNFAYDFGIWFVAAPLSLYFCAFYMDVLIPVDSDYSLFRWPFFVYLVGLSLIFYRALVAYAKWAFPVNTLKENKDRAFTHRLVLGGVVSWLFYRIANTVYGMLVG